MSWEPLSDPLDRISQFAFNLENAPNNIATVQAEIKSLRAHSDDEQNVSVQKQACYAEAVKSTVKSNGTMGKRIPCVRELSEGSTNTRLEHINMVIDYHEIQEVKLTRVLMLGKVDRSKTTPYTIVINLENSFRNTHFQRSVSNLTINRKTN